MIHEKRMRIHEEWLFRIVDRGGLGVRYGNTSGQPMYLIDTDILIYSLKPRPKTASVNRGSGELPFLSKSDRALIYIKPGRTDLL